jgi:hypothetical protein
VNQYVSLPSGIGGMRTFAGWVNWNGGGTWQRIFDFGASSASYAMLTTRANNGALRFEITPAGGAEARQLDAPAPLPTNVWTYVAVALDGRQAVMFVNGRAVAANSSVNLLPSDVAGRADYFGRSQFPADPYFIGQMDSLEIASRCLTVEEITASSISLWQSPGGLNLSWPALDTGQALFATPNLNPAAWIAVGNSPSITNGFSMLTLSPTNQQTWFRLQLP